MWSDLTKGPRDSMLGHSTRGHDSVARLSEIYCIRVAGLTEFPLPREQLRNFVIVASSYKSFKGLNTFCKGLAIFPRIHKCSSLPS